MFTIPPSACTLVIPAYNEEQRIGRTLAGLAVFRGEVVFVCDGTDATPSLIEAFAAEHPELRIRCLRSDRRLGKGGAVAAGFRAAVTPYVGFMDADGSTGVEDMAGLFDRLDRLDGAVGSRWVDGAQLKVRQGALRRMESRAFNLFIRLLFGLDFMDTQCGAKVFRREAILAVLPDLVSTGFEFDVEILWRLRKAGYSIGEFPITWEDRSGSKVGFSDIIAMVAGLVRVRLSPSPH